MTDKDDEERQRRVRDFLANTDTVVFGIRPTSPADLEQLARTYNVTVKWLKAVMRPDKSRIQ